MKKVNIFLTSLFLILSIKCVQNEEVEPIPEEVTREKTSIQNEESLAIFKEDLEEQSANSRVSNDLMERVNWNEVNKAYNSSSGLTTYTLPLIVDDSSPGQFDNLIVVENSEERHGYILRYIPEQNWLSAKPRRSGLKNFTGTMQIVGLNGLVQASTEYTGGVPEIDHDRRAGRVYECETWLDVLITVVCIGDDCSISNIDVIEYEICDTNGGSGSPSGTGSPGGTGGPNGTGTTGGGPTPLGGGDSDVNDPVDVSYWLTALNPNDNVSNPYDGMQAVDSHGVIYTYYANLNAWVAPDVQVLLDNGHQINFFNNQFQHDLDGAVLSTVIAIALVEPTPIGEIIVGGIILSVWIYEWSQVDTEEYPNEACLDFYEECLRWNEVHGGNLSCSSCVSVCYQSGIGLWPFDLCPIGY